VRFDWDTPKHDTRQQWDDRPPTLTASISALAAIRKPAEYLELQQTFMAEAMNAAIAESAPIVKRTTAAFTAPFKPR